MMVCDGCDGGYDGFSFHSDWTKTKKQKSHFCTTLKGLTFVFTQKSNCLGHTNMGSGEWEENTVRVTHNVLILSHSPTLPLTFTIKYRHSQLFSDISVYLRNGHFYDIFR